MRNSLPYTRKQCIYEKDGGVILQIQEVSNRTGLTKRTIRFYIEKELIDPAIVVRNGKEYREYSEKDLKELETIAELRRALFSIEQIKAMMDNPSEIPVILEEYNHELEENHRNISRLIKVMEGLRGGAGIKDIYQLSLAVSDVSKGMTLPAMDITPNFARLDREFGTEGDSQVPRARFFTKWFALFIAAVVLISASVCFIYWNNRTLHPKFAGQEYTFISKTDRSVVYHSGGGETVVISADSNDSRGIGKGLSTLAYCTYYINVTKPDGTEIEYAYLPTDGAEVWIVGKYDLYGFARPARFRIDGEYVTVSNYKAISPEVRFVIDSITAYRNYTPLYRAMIPAAICIPASFILWIILVAWWNSRKDNSVRGTEG